MSRPDPSRKAYASERRSPLAVLSTWIERHVQTLVSSLGKLVRQPFATVLTVGVIGLGLALPACLYLVVLNAAAVTEGIGSTVQLSVYLKIPMTAEQAQKVLRSIEARDDVLDARSTFCACSAVIGIFR